MLLKQQQFLYCKNMFLESFFQEGLFFFPPKQLTGFTPRTKTEEKDIGLLKHAGSWHIPAWNGMLKDTGTSTLLLLAASGKWCIICTHVLMECLTVEKADRFL